MSESLSSLADILDIQTHIPVTTNSMNCFDLNKRALCVNICVYMCVRVFVHAFVFINIYLYIKRMIDT